MAPALTAALLLFIHSFTVSALESTSQQVGPPRHPHLTECFSASMETFRCRWSVGSFRNVSEPGHLRLFYVNKPSITKDWTECPHYSSDRAGECFFSENHTTVWTNYGVQLRSGDLSHLYDESQFNVYDIVRPDPPFDLTWTPLNVSLSGHFYDVMLTWKPPESADVNSGWMRLKYEVQHRNIDSDLWEADLTASTHCTVYGLQTNVNHEVRVRCRMMGGKQFGEFSDSVLIHIPSKVSRFPVAAVLIFGALCLVAILMLVIISRQEKLMVLLLPPVPGPKIRGIDPELLKRGKLRELTSILGGPPNLRPELYNTDPWVEFIDLDIEEHHDMLTDLDTRCLVDRSVTSGGSPVSIGFRDDDSGRASCCDPDLPSDAEASLFHPLIPNQMLREDAAASEVPTAEEPPVSDLGREAMYTQVSDVRSSGKVILSPEEQTEAVEQHKEAGAEKEKEKKELKLMVENVDNSGYTSELNAGKMSPGDFSADPPRSAGDNQRPETAAQSPLPPAPVYTMVEGVDRQNSLLLTSNSTPAPQLIIPKPMPTPEGYLTPDLFGSITP